MFTKQPSTSKRREYAVSTGASRSRTSTVSREIHLRIFLIFGPLVLLVTLMRLIEYSVVIRTGTPQLGLILSSAAPTPFLLLLLSLAFYAWLRVRWPYLRPAWHVVVVSLMTALLMVAISVLAPAWTTEWLSHRAFEAIRWDILLLLLTALAFLFLLERTRGWIRVANLTALYSMVFVLMFLPAATLGYLLSTGSSVDGTLFRHFLLHIPDLTSVVFSEVRGLRVLLLFLPLLILLLPVLLRLLIVRHWALSSSKAMPTGTPWHVLWGTLPVLLLLVLPPSTPLPEAYKASTYVSLVEGMVRKASAETAQIMSVTQQHTTPLFDTQTLRFVTTENTRLLNVVVILLESLRARSTTPYNPELDTTPFLDSLARHGLLVEQMYAVVPYTNKSLTPVFAGIYGYPHRKVVEGWPGGVPGRGLPSLLKPLGYRSAFFTPVTLDYEHKGQILKNLGFEETWGDGAFDTEAFTKTNYFGFEDRVVVAASMDWVDERVAVGEPFFLGYLTLVAHHPYIVPPSFPLHDYGVGDKAFNRYLNAVRYTDEFLRELFHAFEARGLLSSTLFIMLGDHGQAFGEHKQRMHPDVIWDEVLHVPAVLYNPVLFPKGRRISGRRQQIDLLPTVADALGLQTEGGFYPGSFLLQPVPPGRTLYHSGWESNVAMALRRDSLKYMLQFQQRPMHVFAIDTDSLELVNVAGDLPPSWLRTAEMELMLWRRSVQQIYNEHLRQLAQ